VYQVKRRRTGGLPLRSAGLDAVEPSLPSTPKTAAGRANWPW
jgi:hypothetical protein